MTRFFPLIDADSDGIEKVAMIPTTQESTAIRNHRMHLRELERNLYALHSREPQRLRDYLGFKVHCPCCGHVMDIVDLFDGRHETTYRCPRCR
jgi:hypothetical protein